MQIRTIRKEIQTIRMKIALSATVRVRIRVRAGDVPVDREWNPNSNHSNEYRIQLILADMAFHIYHVTNTLFFFLLFFC